MADGKHDTFVVPATSEIANSMKTERLGGQTLEEIMLAAGALAAVPALFLVPARLGRGPAFDRLWTLAGAVGLALFTLAFSAGFWAG